MSKFWAYLKTRSFRNTLLAAIGSILLLLFIAYLSLDYYTRHGSGVPVPLVKGLSADKAIQTLSDQGFGYQIDSRFYVPDEPPGTIVEQDPGRRHQRKGKPHYLPYYGNPPFPPCCPARSFRRKIISKPCATLSNFGFKGWRYHLQNLI